VASLFDSPTTLHHRPDRVGAVLGEVRENLDVIPGSVPNLVNLRRLLFCPALSGTSGIQFVGLHEKSSSFGGGCLWS